mmetsp:Transcript_58499/g.136991  ORF Transcript_58499/g.136991 Transcript_58499/m.136991 type:complete len:267 (-) Transcript_58499:99-899(-)
MLRWWWSGERDSTDACAGVPVSVNNGVVLALFEMPRQVSPPSASSVSSCPAGDVTDHVTLLCCELKLAAPSAASVMEKDLARPSASDRPATPLAEAGACIGDSLRGFPGGSRSGMKGETSSSACGAVIPPMVLAGKLCRSAFLPSSLRLEGDDRPRKVLEALGKGFRDSICATGSKTPTCRMFGTSTDSSACMNVFCFRMESSAALLKGMKPLLYNSSLIVFFSTFLINVSISLTPAAFSFASTRTMSLRPRRRGFDHSGRASFRK